MKVLVVDDFTTMRRIIRNLLTGLGYKSIDEAENGKEALAKLNKGNYDLIVTDWNMPKMNGLELLESVRKSDSLCAIPVIMVTAEAKRDQIVAAAKAGVNGYIVKPFTGEQLKDKLNKVFARVNG